MFIIDKIKLKLKGIERKFISPSRPQALILMYHRIKKMKYDPWDLCVSEEHFEEHLDLLAHYFEVYPLSCLRDGSFKRGTTGKKVFITFDDGYLDNYESAFPLLKKSGLSATFFIPTQSVNSTGLFWWEVVDLVFGQGLVLPEIFHLHSERYDFKRILSEEARKPNVEVENNWSANLTDPPTERCRLYLDLCEWIKQKPVDAQKEIANQLMSLFNLSKEACEGYSKMSADQVKSLSDRGFEIGSHSINHPSLKFQNADVQRQEIQISKKQLEDLTGKPILTFAYPHGDFNEQTKGLVQESGFSLACTTENRGIYSGDGLYSMPRIWIYNYDADNLEQNLNYFFAFNL